MDVHTVWKPTCRSLGDCFQPNIQTCMETCVNDWGNPMLIIFHPSSIHLPSIFPSTFTKFGMFPMDFSHQFFLSYPNFPSFSHGFFPWIFPMDFPQQFPGLQIFLPLKRANYEVWCLGRPAYRWVCTSWGCCPLAEVRRAQGEKCQMWVEKLIYHK